MFFKWWDAKFVFRRGYFCCGGVPNFCLGGGTSVMEEGVFLSGGMQSVCFGGSTSAVEEGVFLNWRGTVQFMFWKVCEFDQELFSI